MSEKIPVITRTLPNGIQEPVEFKVGDTGFDTTQMKEAESTEK